MDFLARTPEWVPLAAARANLSAWRARGDGRAASRTEKLATIPEVGLAARHPERIG
jgi:hypothetical protein